MKLERIGRDRYGLGEKQYDYGCVGADGRQKDAIRDASGEIGRTKDAIRDASGEIGRTKCDSGCIGRDWEKKQNSIRERSGEIGRKSIFVMIRSHFGSSHSASTSQTVRIGHWVRGPAWKPKLLTFRYQWSRRRRVAHVTPEATRCRSCFALGLGRCLSRGEVGGGSLSLARGCRFAGRRRRCLAHGRLFSDCRCCFARGLDGRCWLCSGRVRRLMTCLNCG